MKITLNSLFLLLVITEISCKQKNPVDFQGKLVGEWQLFGAKDKKPNLLIYPMVDGGLFVYDNLAGKWRSYSAWLSDDRSALLGRQGCTKHYSFRLSYLPIQDKLIIDDSLVLMHTNLVPRQLENNRAKP